MLSRTEAGKKSGGGSSAPKKLLKDVETINKALYLDRGSTRSSIPGANSRSKFTGKSQLPDPKSKSKTSVNNNNDDGVQKDKKSIWNWRPLRALSHIRNKRFNCSFYLQVHLIEGLPPSFDNASLAVYWKRRDGVLVTGPAKVIQSVAEFEEKLTYTCSVYGSRSGPHHSAKYEAKHFLLYASLLSAQEMDLGKHRVDLTRLLPLTLEELEEEKSSGKWTTSFRLSGVAKGAVMNVSFGYTVVGDNASTTRDSHNASNVLSSRQNSFALMKQDVKPRQFDGSSRMRRTTSMQLSPRASDEVKDLHEVLPMTRSALASSIDILYKKFDEEKASSMLSEAELDSFSENLGSIKPDAYASDFGKETFDEHVSKAEDKCPVHEEPELSVFQEKLEIFKLDDNPLPDSTNENPEQFQGNEFFVVDKGIELSSNEPVIREEFIGKAPEDASTVDTAYTLDISGTQEPFEDSVKHDFLDEVNDISKDQVVVEEFAIKEDGFDSDTNELLLQELESALNSVSNLERVALESPKTAEFKSEHKKTKSHSLDDVTESVASEFLSMLDLERSRPMALSSESEPESPRELLLRQFEKEALDGDFSSLFDFEMNHDNEADGGYDGSAASEQWNFSEDVRSSSLLQDLQEEHLAESQDVRSKQRAQTLEDLETEALMRQWGLNEEAFHHSPPKDFTGFGSPIPLPPEEPPILPPLDDGLGPFLQTKDGGFLRSMNPSLFKNSKSGGSLIMQVSNPVVVPAEMGSGIMEVLQCLASVGIEKLSMQAKELMPLEDITGKTMQQVAWEAMPVLEGAERQSHLQHNPITRQDSAHVQRDLKGMPSVQKSGKFSSRTVANQPGSEFVSVEDLAPLAMDKIEALSMEGLRIQSGMSEEEAPSNIIAQSIGDISALQGKGFDISGSLGLDGAAGLQLMDVKDGGDSGDGVDGIMGLSLTLDEWMRLDSGEIDDIDNISEHTSKLLAAHHANSFDFIRGSSKGEKRRGKSRRCGLLGNNFTVALMVQLRDPLRNYEPVGTPMLALIQVEREFMLPKQKIFNSVSLTMKNNDEDDDDDREILAKVDVKDTKNEGNTSEEEEGIPQFRITEVHVAGLKPEPQKTKFWGTSNQQQSGSRWLLANGMGKNNNNKLPLMKPKGSSKSNAPVISKVQPGDSLWSISSRLFGNRGKSHVRNPDVVMPNDTIRLS
ncbi:protein PLASTID MOVEMENT IMPAIRED 1-RELATED 1-like [Vigna umbellata]|uniref:protein PLASTID MOVEMENT IMPAIRED 1-RELATED 1-like n=1 Tax=Vigna umbellata TaxID=87088 RepID=UPI001F5F2647|nr:protein PLASTID MOVEMENT IMPAIRED 1-RELATED 1-like [Vigna umbellata]XP_047174841.1 protein PLASTID MOVEMENT IMPAIRED 1-RELATED 1-like [Vigna umbellata]